jgi:DNA polymerase III alpha subunit
MTVLGKKLDLPDRVPNGSLGAHVGRQVCVAGVLVASRRARTRSGEFMMFVSLEDETAVVECVLFPDVYQKCGHVLISRGPYVAWGTVENQHGAITLAVQRLTIADPATAPNT